MTRQSKSDHISKFDEHLYPLDLGVEHVFDYVYQGYFAPLCFYAEQYVGDESLDVVNNVFAKLWSSGTQFETTGHLKSFLYVATRNACLDFLKVHARSKLRETEYGRFQHLSDEEVEAGIIENEYLAEIYRELKKLPSQCGKIIEMTYIQGFKNEEVAAQLGLSLQTVKNQKHKGLKVLRSRFLSSPSKYLFLLFLLRL